MSQEQRRHPRLPLSEETIYFSEERHGYEIERIHYSGTLINISQSGIGLLATHPHELNEELCFEGLEGSNRALIGAVRWVREQNPESFEVGIEFRQ